MSGPGVLLGRRTLWTALMGLAALAFWVVAFGVGWRAWLLTGSDFGIVAHVSEFGLQAAPWGIVAAILTLTTVVMGVGTAMTRHLVDIATTTRAATGAPPLAAPVVPELETSTGEGSAQDRTSPS